MFVNVIEVVNRLEEVNKQIEGLKLVHRDCKTLDSTMGNERIAIRAVADKLREEKASLEEAIQNLDRVEI